MKKRLIEIFKKTNYQSRENGLISNFATQFTEYGMNEIADTFIKEGVVITPCKIGDIVYRVSFAHNTVVTLKVEGFLCNIASWKVHCTSLIQKWNANKKDHFYISFSEFGKTVFFTEKEARQKLKGD